MLPPRRILAAVDFSDASRTALTCAARLAAHCAAALHVLHAQEPLFDPSAGDRDVTGEIRGELQAFTRSTLEHPRSAGVPVAPPSCTQHVVFGPPIDVICNIADREQSDLIVVGASGMSGSSRPMFGTITEGVLRCADVSVLIVPVTWRPPRPDTADLTGIGPLVVGVELSEPSLGAAAGAIALGARLQASVHFVHVVPTATVLPRWQTDVAAGHARRVEQAATDLASAIEGLAPNAASRLRVEVGNVAETLAAAAAPANDRHPLLVLGRRAHADRCGAPGATAYRVLMLAQSPVLIHLPEPAA